eukprot:CAMPEP_0197177358 /NCGR_PEP_ID=MMETSP1423-20130617/2984_1 /TAXON_ID=476441 /ORGANISM="Pseudo-nitzschia heimii, Strain UNC1101" /LENGTH=540 /DNA_ID=CAMNT_0042626893 /DNA_START=224 /DNA_END=1846 /DNA_ORIENTATION=+
MKLEERSKSFQLEQQHKDHLTSLMMNNAKSSLASGVALSDSVAGVYNPKTGVINSSGISSGSSSSNDDLGNSSRSQKSSDEASSLKAAQAPTKTMNTGRWSADEHKRFLAGLDQFGTGNWKKITEMVGTRSCTQIRTHAQKYFIALQKPQNDGEKGGYARKKSKMLVGADHHLNSNIKTGSSAIVTGYGGGGTPIHPSGIVPVTGALGTAGSKNNTGAPTGAIKHVWGPEGLRELNAGLSGMEVLAQAAITGEKQLLSAAPSDDRPPVTKLQPTSYQVHYESSLDKAVAELRKKMADEADAAVIAKNATSVKPPVTPSSFELSKEVAESEGKKRKISDARAAAVISSYQEHKKLKESDYAAAVQDTIDRKDVLDKLHAVAERQEFLRLRQEVKTLNQTILQLQQQSIQSDNRVMEAITDRRVTLNECKNLREINAQLKTELRRMVLLFEHSGASNNHGNSSALMAAATQGANVELMQARLTESELRYHTVTESLSRQTGVLTDQHRAILELNNQLEKERAKRQRLEYELNEVKNTRTIES